MAAEKTVVHNECLVTTLTLNLIRPREVKVLDATVRLEGRVPAAIGSLLDLTVHNGADHKTG